MKKSIIFCGITWCSPLKDNRLATPAFTLVSCSAYSTLKVEMICSSETSVHFQRTIRYYISEDRTLHNHGCENVKSYIGEDVWRI
jgi:hypothetical protein